MELSELSRVALLAELSAIAMALAETAGQKADVDRKLRARQDALRREVASRPVTEADVELMRRSLVGLRASYFGSFSWSGPPEADAGDACSRLRKNSTVDLRGIETM